MHWLRWSLTGVFLLGLVSSPSAQETKDGWIVLFNGKDTAGWRLRQEKTTDGWIAENDELRCVKPHGGNDLLTEQKFTDFELHIEFQATSNSGVYLQGRYEIQVNNDYKAKPKIVEKDGKKIEVWDTHQCGAIYGLIAPSKNMAKPPKEWQSFDVIFHGARGANGKVTKKARVTLIWNGAKVIDNAEIDRPTGGALDGKPSPAHFFCKATTARWPSAISRSDLWRPRRTSSAPILLNPPPTPLGMWMKSPSRPARSSRFSPRFPEARFPKCCARLKTLPVLPARMRKKRPPNLLNA